MLSPAVGHRRAFIEPDRVLALLAIIVISMLLVAAVSMIPDPEVLLQQRRELARACTKPNAPIAMALSAYRWDLGAFPTTEAGLAAITVRRDRVEDARYMGPYLGRDDLLDPWGRPFRYVSPGVHRPKEYDLWSVGEDGIDDKGLEGSDDITNWKEK